MMFTAGRNIRNANSTIIYILVRIQKNFSSCMRNDIIENVSVSYSRTQLKKHIKVNCQTFIQARLCSYYDQYDENTQFSHKT